MEELSTSLRRFSCSDHLDKGHERSKKRYDKDAKGETFACSWRSGVVVCTSGEAGENEEVGIVLERTVYAVIDRF